MGVLLLVVVAPILFVLGAIFDFIGAAIRLALVLFVIGLVIAAVQAVF